MFSLLLLFLFCVWHRKQLFGHLLFLSFNVGLEGRDLGFGGSEPGFIDQILSILKFLFFDETSFLLADKVIANLFELRRVYSLQVKTIFIRVGNLEFFHLVGQESKRILSLRSRFVSFVPLYLYIIKLRKSSMGFSIGFRFMRKIIFFDGSMFIKI